jgi:hypothetical protein
MLQVCDENIPVWLHIAWRVEFCGCVPSKCQQRQSINQPLDLGCTAEGKVGSCQQRLEVKQLAADQTVNLTIS